HPQLHPFPTRRSSDLDAAGTLWYVPEASKDKIAKLAPSIGISVYDRQLTEPLQRLWELAESLGADMKAAKVTGAKTKFEAAAARDRKSTRLNSSHVSI